MIARSSGMRFNFKMLLLWDFQIREVKFERKEKRTKKKKKKKKYYPTTATGD